MLGVPRGTGQGPGGESSRGVEEAGLPSQGGSQPSLGRSQVAPGTGAAPVRTVSGPGSQLSRPVQDGDYFYALLLSGKT